VTSLHLHNGETIKDKTDETNVIKAKFIACLR